jgi:hypothetical protein
MWSSRLAQSIGALGHEARIVKTLAPQAADAAIVNLGEHGVAELIGSLHALGVKTIGHAGHKEKELHELGRAAGCDILATNSELTFKLPSLLARV